MAASPATRQKVPSATYTYLSPSSPPAASLRWASEAPSLLPAAVTRLGQALPLGQRDDTGCLTCLCCHRVFSSEQDFLVHQRCHTGERPFQCSRCFETFASASALLLHRGSLHDSRSPFRCTFCGRAFQAGDAYSRHLSRHRRAGISFRCSCTRLFRTDEELQAHLDMHDSGTGHKCPSCRKVYESLLALGVHFEKHDKDGKKPLLRSPRPPR